MVWGVPGGASGGGKTVLLKTENIENILLEAVNTYLTHFLPTMDHDLVQHAETNPSQPGGPARGPADILVLLLLRLAT